jgi:hypothetical protein
MGYTVLYIAFGVVALWLLGEVLLQYKARLRWRLLAFAGFLGVVAGVWLPSIIVIAIGAVAFGTGQTFVTLSYRKGFVAGWALPVARRKALGLDDPDTDPDLIDRAERRRRNAAAAEAAEAAEAEAAATGEMPQYRPAEETMAPVGASYGQDPDEVTPFGVGYDPTSSAAGVGSTQVFQPVPINDDSGEYPVYGGRGSYGNQSQDPYGGYQGQDYGNQDYGNQGYDGWGGQQQQQPAAAGYDTSYGGWGTQDQNQGYSGYGYDQNGQQAQPGYTDPYGNGQGQDQYQQQYQGQYGYDTPPGGVWSGDQQQPYIPQQSQDPYYDQQQQPQQNQYGDPHDPYRYQG